MPFFLIKIWVLSQLNFKWCRSLLISSVSSILIAAKGVDEDVGEDVEDWPDGEW